MLGDTYPDYPAIPPPSLWQPAERDTQDRDQANDGWTQINSWEPPGAGGIIFNPHAEWNVLTKTQHTLLRRHWRRNSRKTFRLFNFRFDEIIGLYVAQQAGVTRRFTLPAKSVTGLVVYVDTGAGPALPSQQPALLTGQGADGADDIEFAVGTLPAGAVITFDAQDARQRFDVIYESVEIEPGRRGGGVYQFAVDFIEQPRSVVA